METIESAIVESDFLTRTIESRKHNLPIEAYYYRYIEELQSVIWILNDLSFVVVGKKRIIKKNVLVKKIKEIFSSLFFQFDEKHLFNYDDVIALRDKVKERISVFSNKITNLERCNKVWLLDKYEIQKIKDIKKQNLCRDKFCSNCKKVTQSARSAKYVPALEQYKDTLYHLTLTLPNCNAQNLRLTMNKMAKSFKFLIRYLNGNLKIKGIDFSDWGYQGAVRSYEVTFHGDSYHPHFHVGIILDSNVLSIKKYRNTYSYNYKKGVPELKTLFSKEELLIQKIWCLLIDGKKVTKVNIENLKKGYSCTIGKFKPDEYAELFKYITKEMDETGYVLSYDNFKALYASLYRLKQIQGYGCLYRIKDDIDLEEYKEAYNMLIESIRKKENPVEVSEAPQDLLLDNQYTLISRKSYFKHLRSLYHEES